MVQCGRAACMFSIPVSVCFEKQHSRGLVRRCHRWWGCARLATGWSGTAAKPCRSGPMWKGIPDMQLPDNQPVKITRKPSQEKVQRCPNIVVNERFIPDKVIFTNSLVKEFLRSVTNGWQYVETITSVSTHGCTTWLFQHVMPGQSHWLMCQQEGLALCEII